MDPTIQTMIVFREKFSRNNHNASKLIEKYNNLAREALSSGDKILSENYFQHADHFTRILNEKSDFRKAKNSKDIAETSEQTNNDQKKIDSLSEKEKTVQKKFNLRLIN